MSSSLAPYFALLLSCSSRLLLRPKAALQDAAAVAVVSSIWHRELLYHFVSHAPSNTLLIGLFTTSVVFAFIATIPQSAWFGKPQPTAYQMSASGLRPLMIPCRTTHTRLFPVKHSFSYSYLFVGIPVGWTGRADTILSADRHCGSKQAGNQRTWFSVAAEDYLGRGSHPDGLRGKLSDYLRSQGTKPEQYNHALLVTAPRFLGFSFNPVSFWYLYNEAKVLEAMVVEVNNTFDERRMYFMERKSGGLSASAEAVRRFHHSWEKDFHVSPFNSRDGLYTIQATDPLADMDLGRVNVDCNITLRGADQKTKLVARVFSTHPAVDAASMTRWQTLAFVIRWWWVGLMTNPRILREARILWVKRLQIYYRPEVLKTSIGRQESLEEAQLEPYFRLLLEQLVRYSQDDIHLNYIPAAGIHRGTSETIFKADTTQRSQRMIEIRVLTPALYSQFVRFRDWRKAFDKLCFDAPDSEQFLFISDRANFLELLLGIEHLYMRTYEPLVRWQALGWLRGKEPTHMSPSLTAGNCIGGDDRSLCGLSQLDLLVSREADRVSKRRYCRTVAAVLISDRLAFGWVPILRFYGLVIWLFLVCVATSSVQNLVRSKRADGSGNHLLTTLGILGPHLWACGAWLI